jgi:hypothetical protein
VDLCTGGIFMILWLTENRVVSYSNGMFLIVIIVFYLVV